MWNGQGGREGGGKGSRNRRIGGERELWAGVVEEGLGGRGGGARGRTAERRPKRRRKNCRISCRSEGELKEEIVMEEARWLGKKRKVKKGTGKNRKE